MSLSRLGRRERVAGIVLFVALTLSSAAAQPQPTSAAEIIRYLTYQGRPGRYGLAVFSCGTLRDRSQKDGPFFDSLVRMGDSAVPEIEKALDSLDAKGGHSKYGVGAGWLLYAYAEIKGAGAFMRLARLVRNPKLDFARPQLDNSIAVSLGLTSYVDSYLPLLNMLPACSSAEPRHALDQLILSWEKNDLRWLRTALGPHAAEASRSMPWPDAQVDLKRAGRPLALGYRFQIEGPWSQPVKPLDVQGTVEHAASPEIDTEFTDRLGKTCGSYRVKFVRTALERNSLPIYLVDNSDLRDLLRTFASCADMKPRTP